MYTVYIYIHIYIHIYIISYYYIINICIYIYIWIIEIRFDRLPSAIDSPSTLSLHGISSSSFISDGSPSSTSLAHGERWNWPELLPDYVWKWGANGDLMGISHDITNKNRDIKGMCAQRRYDIWVCPNFRRGRTHQNLSSPWKWS